MACALTASVTVSPAGAAQTVRLPRPCVRTSVLVTARTTQTPALARATRTGLDLTALLVCHFEPLVLYGFWDMHVLLV